MKKGQISVEFLTIYGFVFLMLIPLVIIFFDQVGDIKDSIAENHLRNTAIKILDKAETVYYLGEPSLTTLKVNFPERLDSVLITGRTIAFRYRTVEDKVDSIEWTANVNVTGNISSEPGIHFLKMQAIDQEVLISE